MCPFYCQLQVSNHPYKFRSHPVDCVNHGRSMRRYALEMRENVAAEFRKQLWEALQLVVLEQSRLIYHVMLIIVNDIVESINVSVFF